MASSQEVRTRLAASALPADAVEELIEGASGPWLLSDDADVLSADLAHCHPPLAPGELRVDVRRQGNAGGEAWARLTVVAHDRPGLLAATAAVLAAQGLSVVAASITTWTDRGMALQGVTFADPGARLSEAGVLDEVARDVRAGLNGERQFEVVFRPEGPVEVASSPVITPDHALVTVQAPDRVGLLWAIATWFASQEINVEAATLDDRGGRAKDTFLVLGSPDVQALALHLGGKRSFWASLRL
jgi:UTP:GlnB (protein PII) uridylyltransferase